MNAKILVVILIASAILSVSVVVSAFVIATYNRYEIVVSEACYRLDKKTGRVWLMRSSGMKEVLEEKSQ